MTEPATGNHTTNGYDQRALPGPRQEIAHVRPETANHRSRGIEAPLLFASDSTRAVTLHPCTAQNFFSHLRIELISPPGTNLISPAHSSQYPFLLALIH